MVKKITKRDGKLDLFNPQKIKNAILKANLEVSDESISSTDITKKVIDKLGDKPLTSVEEVQDLVEEQLITNGCVKTAKAYILYRAEHAKMRTLDSQLMKTYEDITFKSSEDADIKRENANIDADTAMGTMLKYGSEGAKYFYDAYVIPADMSKAHQIGDIHIHDKDFYTLTETCCQIDLIKLFSGGFSTGHGHLREPNDIRSYAALACIAIQANQNEMHGGQSVPNFDYAMAQGVAKTFYKSYFNALAQILEITKNISNAESQELVSKTKDALGVKLSIANEKKFGDALDKYLKHSFHKYAFNTGLRDTEKATYQAMEALIHNLNTMNSRAGAQVPFSSINYGTDTSPEARIVIRNLLSATEAGLGDGETAIFPIQIFKVKEGVNYNPEDVNYDLFQLAIKVSAKRLFPNFSFIDAPFNYEYYRVGKPETEVAYMGCRTRVISNKHDDSRQIVNGRGNLSFTSINLPRVALGAEHDISRFYSLLDEKIKLVSKQLLHRFRIQCSKKVYNYPFLMGQGIWIDSEHLASQDCVAEVLKHGTLSIGFIGLAETLTALIGEHHGQSESAQKLGLEIISHMRKRMEEKSVETNLNFSLIGTPAEGLSGRFVKLDREKYGVISGVTDHDFYTNSFHIPVYFKIKAYDKIQKEAPYHALTNAGHISYVELDGDTCKNLSAFEAIIRCMKESGIGYGSVNHPVDRDSSCGYNGIIDEVCPKCGRIESDGPKFERIRRITGYLVGTTERWNNAKRAEEKERVKHC